MIKWIRRLLGLVIVLVLGAVFFFLAVGYMHYKNSINDKSIVEAMSKIQNQAHYTSLDMISDDFEKAIIAIEDSRFYNRYGVDLISIGKAFVNGLEKGTFNEGGSTITQQLAKNIYFSFDRSLIRKSAEIFMTRDFEDSYSKEDILAAYVNVIYYGDGYYGIYEASMGYFNVLPSELSLAQSAMLAGLPQSPSIYQLSTGYEFAKARQKQVLAVMLEDGIITTAQYDEALAVDLRVVK